MMDICHSIEELNIMFPKNSFVGFNVFFPSNLFNQILVVIDCMDHEEAVLFDGNSEELYAFLYSNCLH